MTTAWQKRWGNTRGQRSQRRCQWGRNGEQTESLWCAIDTSSPGLWDIDQVATYLGTGRRYVYRLTEERRIRYVRISGRLRFRPSDVAEWLERKSRPAEQRQLHRGGRPRRRRAS